MPASNLPTPTPDELDDLIYSSRTGDLETLTELITSLCATHAISPSVLLASSIDVDASGLGGTQSSLLHYPAANGNLAVIKYLLGLLSPSQSLGEREGPSATTVKEDNSAAAAQLVNHRNGSGNTPLHWAAMNGHLDVVKALVGAGADARVKNESGRDCIVEAEAAGENGKEGCKECVVWMLMNCEGVDGDSGGGGGGGGAEEEEGEVEESGKGKSKESIMEGEVDGNVNENGTKEEKNET